MNFNNLLVEKADGMAFVTINRPKVLNAFNRETLSELGKAYQMLSTDDEVKVIITTGSGEKAFVAGADINEIAELNPDQAKVFAKEGQSIFSLVENFNKPVIAAINGFALGGGLEYALSAHLRIASNNAKVGLPEVTLGVIPGYGGTQRLARQIGKGRALELILTGKMVDAHEAYRLGIINQVVPQEELIDEAKKLAKSLMKVGPLANRYALEAINLGLEMDLDKGLALEADLFGLVCASSDAKEGTKAFLEKRKAEFQNK